MFGYLKATSGKRPSGAWTSPSSELQATTLTEDAGSGGPLVLPQVVPTITPTATRPLTVADLLAAGSTDSNAVSTMRESAYTNNADTVAEGAAKPEGALTFTSVTDPVRKIAHWIPVTEEMLDDVPALRSYLDVRLRLGVDLALDDQLLNGTVVAPDLVGILNRTGLAAAVARGTDTNADAIAKQINAIWVATGVRPDGIVLHPNNWQTVMLAKDSTGQYYGNGPFSAMSAPTLWGIPVAVTPAIAANTALVGGFKTAAQLFRRGGMRVDATNAHSEFFTKNLVAIRAGSASRWRCCGRRRSRQ